MQLIALLAAAVFIFASRPAGAAVLVECLYAANAAGDEIESHPDCARVVSGTVTIAPDHLKRMRYVHHGLAAVLVAGQHYYAKPSGALLPVIAHDNGPDRFAEGLSRSLVGGRIAYHDVDFKQVVPPTYDWAWPFEGGRALVCAGCTAAAPDSDGHVMISGGRWGYIDRRGTEVVPVQLTEEQARHLRGSR